MLENFCRVTQNWFPNVPAPDVMISGSVRLIPLTAERGDVWTLENGHGPGKTMTVPASAIHAEIVAELRYPEKLSYL